MSSRRKRPVLRTVVVAVAVLLLVAGGLGLVDAATRDTARSDASFPAAQIERVQVDIEAGDVEIVTGTTDEILVETRTVSSLLGDADAVASGDGGTLALTGRCSGWVGTCSVSYRVVLPADATVPVEMEATAGDLTAAGLGGAVTARTTAGDVSLTAFEGPIVDVSTTAGDVEVQASVAPSRLDARTTAGDVLLIVPDGDDEVDVTTTAGDEDVEIADTPGADHRIVARTTAGDVIIRRR